jgi:hypothetical protein
MEWMKRIKNLNVRSVRTQGIMRASSHMRKCIHLTCFRQIIDHQLTCSEHWRMLPDAIKQEIAESYRARVNGMEGADLLWAHTKKRAIDALAQQRVSAAAAR